MMPVFRATSENATEEKAGIAKIATQEDASAGKDDTKIMTPLKVATVLSNESTKLKAQIDANSDAILKTRNELQTQINGQATSITEAQGDIVDLQNNKQDVISDLDTIRSGAGKGATAVQPSDLSTVATSGSYNDLSNKPTIPQSLSDIAVAGSNVTFETPINIDYVASSNKVNSPSIVNGLFTTTSSSYLQINNASISNYSGSIFTGNYSWAWTVKFKTPADVSEEHTIFRMGSSLTDFNVWCALSVSTSTPKVISAALHLSNNVWTNSETGFGITEVKPNTWYWVRLSRDISTNTYKFEISEDGEVWSTEISYVSTYSFYNTKSDLLLSGQYGSNLGTTEYDLTGCSFTSNYSSGINWVAYIHDERTSINATVPSITVDQTYNSASANAQSGKAVASALSVKQNVIEDLSDIRSGAELGSTAVQPSSLATVATSGSYNDLSDKPTIPTTTIQDLSTTDSITLADNTIYNGGEQTALTITLPTTDTIGFICEVDFSSGSAATTLSYSLPDIFWEGTDVAYDSTAQKNIFKPVENKRYTIIFYFDGVNYNGCVGGV